MLSLFFTFPIGIEQLEWRKLPNPFLPSLHGQNVNPISRKILFTTKTQWRMDTNVYLDYRVELWGNLLAAETSNIA